MRVERLQPGNGQRTAATTIVPEGLPEPASVFLADGVDQGRWYVCNYTVVPSAVFVLGAARP